jgi:hypothetical protein
VRREVPIEIREVLAQHRLAAERHDAHGWKRPVGGDARHEAAKERRHAAEDRDAVLREPIGELGESALLDVEGIERRAR